MSRPSKDHYFMSLALLAAQRASCPRRKVGCVLIDDNDHVVSTGYNGPPSGTPNCTDVPCGGHNQPSGSGLSLCKAIHAEVNAFNQAGDRLKTVTKMYLTAGPCCPLCTDTAVKLIEEGKLQNLKTIYFFDQYPSDTAKIFQDLGISLICLDKNLDEKGFLFALAVTLGFRLQPNAINRAVCVGGVLHGCTVTIQGSYLQANAEDTKPEELRELKYLKHTVDYKAPKFPVIHEYYETAIVKSNKRIKIMRYVNLSDSEFYRLVHDLHQSNIGRPIY